MTNKIHEWRAFVGPRYEDAGSASRFEWWTPANLTESTELDANLSASAASVVLATALSLDSRGGVWVGPNGAGEGWEYISYTARNSTTLSGCTRESAATREHSGIHTAGAVVRQWWPLESNDGALRLSETMDDSLGVITWSAAISGWKAPAAALRDGHVVVVQTRELYSPAQRIGAPMGALAAITQTAGDPTASAWTTLLIGFLRDIRLSDSGRKLGEWQCSIVSPASILQGHRAPGLRIGSFSLAGAASVRTATVLADVRRESQSGDFTEAAPQVAGASIVDENAGSLWIAERVVGPAEVAANAPSGYNSFASKIRINRWPGETDKSRYIEWRFAAGSFQDSWLCSSTNNPNGENQALIQWNDISTTEGERVIICEHEETFRRLHPEAADADLREIGSAFFDGLDLNADSIGIYDEQFNGWSQTVAWGPSPAVKPHWENPDSGGDDEDGPNMSGTDACDPPLPGQVIRFYYNATASQTADHFVTDYLEYAGYLSGTGQAPWAMLTLPEIGLMLDADIADDEPGASDRLYITDFGGAASTIGLEASGTIQIGLEQITYDDRSVDSVRVVARGANGTTAAAHRAGDLVQVVDSGTATTAPLVARIEWSRERTPAPTQFKIRTAKTATVRAPGEDGYTGDWTLAANVSGHSGLDYGLDLAPARVRHILIEIERMGSGPARPRLNEVRVIVAPAAYDGSLAMAAADVDDVAEAILAGAGYNGALVKSGGQELDGITTDNQADAWQVLASLAQYANALVDVRRDGRIEISTNNLIAGSLSEDATIDEVAAGAVEMVQAATGAVGQVRIPWRTPDGSTRAEARWPTQPDAVGAIEERPEAIFPNSTTAEAAAERAYILARYPVQWLLECVEEQPAIRPGAVVRVQWQFDPDLPQANRLAIVFAADHEITRGRWVSVLHCTQADREAVG